MAEDHDTRFPIDGSPAAIYPNESSMRGANKDSEDSLYIYKAFSRFDRLHYGAKIMLVAFIGIHVPLLGLIGWFVLTRGSGGSPLPVIGVTLVATLLGTALTFFLLHHLLRPIALTASGLRRYVLHGILPTLPIGHHDMAGTLMADASYALRRLDAAIDELEQHDDVTGLPNRTYLLRSLSARSGAGARAPLAVCAIELLGLDTIAQTFGRRSADRVLQLVVQRLVAVLAPGERLHRTDSSTLALLIDSNAPDTIVERLEVLRKHVQELRTSELATELHCRAGVSLGPLDDTDAEALLDDALVALHVAARRGEPLAFYSETSHRDMVEHHALICDLRQALRTDDELTLHYQPMVDIHLNAVVGAEALIRWKHPLRGMVPPSRFIPLAEEGDLIEWIGRWTLETACRQIRSWRDSGVRAPRIAVNLSARQFADPELPRYIGDIVAEHDILPGSLEVELTETAAMLDEARTIDVMRELRALGVGIAIDDFGTGHANMSHLSSMPFSKLKIDREFVRDVATDSDKRAICRSLIALARELRLEVLAEGTESEHQVKALRAEGCRVFQGYHFHRPMPAAAFTTLLRREHEPDRVDAD